MSDSTPERLARVEVRMDTMGEKITRIDNRVDRMENKIDCMDNKISEIHTAVVANGVNTGWVKKLMIIVVSLLLGGGSIVGWKTFANSGTAMAQQQVQVDER